ncbi:hypothetical protein ACFVFJ_49890, partial [Streptomyces sp. NPDC057717]
RGLAKAEHFQIKNTTTTTDSTATQSWTVPWKNNGTDTTPFFLITHGTPDDITVHHQDGSTTRTNASVLTTAVQELPANTPIVLIACATGSNPTPGPGHTTHTQAQSFANASQRPVYAPTTTIGVEHHPNGTTTLYLKPHPTNGKAEFRHFTPHPTTTTNPTIPTPDITPSTANHNTPPTNHHNQNTKHPAHNSLQFAEFPTFGKPPEPPLVAPRKYAGLSPQELGMDDSDFSDSGEIVTAVRDDDSEIEERKEEVYKEASEKYRRETTTGPQPSAGFGKSQFGIRPDRIFPTRRGKPFMVRYRKDHEDLYRYDSRPYETIFAEGFRPWNNKVPRSLRHYMKNTQNSAFVSTTRAEKGYVPNWAVLRNKTAYRYVIKAPGGIDLLETLKTHSFEFQQEVVFWKGIRPEFIERVEVVNKKGEILKVVKREEWEEEKEYDKAATRFLQTAIAAEPRITGMVEIAVKVMGYGKFRGRSHRIKTPDATKRKLKRLMKENPEVSLSMVSGIDDALRYTAEFETAKYAGSVTETVNALRNMGLRLISYRNTWNDSDDKKIDSTWHDGRYVNFEIQFHTRGSYDAMQTAHKLYEEARRPDINAAALATNREARRKLFDRVHIPPDAIELRL